MAATVHVVLSAVRTRNNTANEPMPVPLSVPVEAETLTSAATATPSAIIAGSVEQFWMVTVKGGDVWGAFGAGSITNTAPKRQLLLAGTRGDFAVSAAGEHFACWDA